ncbi:amino acid permease [Pleodorina starrii]|nr:amino acid permease [Pleodorina starrii]
MRGDSAWAFQACLQHCHQTGCTYVIHASPSQQQAAQTCSDTCRRQRRDGAGSEAATGPGHSDGATAVDDLEVPLPLRIFRWSCADDCKYHCMRAVEAWKAVEGRNAPVEKYYGKWPFLRVLGMQELASVLASLANLLAHALCLSRLRAEALRASPHARASPLQAVVSPQPAPVAAVHTPGYGNGSRSPYPFLWLWTAYGCLHINAWVWSAVFHSRDTRLTERLDYTSAICLVAFGLFAVLFRILWGPTRRRLLAAAAAGAAVAAGLARHLHYMLRVKFDYGWNMRVCVAAGLATAGLWLAWCWATRHPGRHRMYAFLLLAHTAMLLELLDFPPLAGLLDAHAAWHVATVALTPLFYSWLRSDAAAALEPKRKDT